MKGSAANLKNLLVSFALMACFSLGLVTLWTATARAESADPVLLDCSDNDQIDGDWSKSQLQNALGSIPADLGQYSSCESAINQALLRKVTKKATGDDSIKGGKTKLKSASAEDLTTPAERRKIREKVEEETALGKVAPVIGSTSPDIKKAAGQTLASDSAPSIPAALIVAVIGLLLLLGLDLAGRLGKMPRVQKILPWQRGGS